MWAYAIASARTLAPSNDAEYGPARTALLAGSDARSSMSFVWAAGLARYFTNAHAASGFFVLTYTTAPVGLIDVACPAGPFGSGAMPRLMPAAWWVATSHEPSASRAALPCSNASPLSVGHVPASGITLSFQMRSWRNWMPPTAWSDPSTVDLRSGARMSPPFCQTSDDQ